VLRLFTAPLSKEASWLLPFGLFGMVLLAFRARPRWPVAPKHQAIVLWGGWLLTDLVFFSVAGFFHEYYLAMFAAPLSALVGITVIELWRIHQGRWWHRWFASVLLLAAAGATGWLQLTTARAFTNSIWWLPAAVGIAVAGALLLIASAAFGKYHVAMAGFACIAAALLVTPAIWSGLTNLNSSANQSLPASYDGRSSGPPNSGVLQVNQELLSYLQSHTQGAKYLMAVPSSMQGADYVLATGRPVLYLGGFDGQDQVLTSDELAAMVTSGDLRYVYWPRNTRGGFGSQSNASSWVTANCTPVQGYDTDTRNAGAPDGTSGGTAPNRGVPSAGGGLMQISLYQCSAGPKY
jgi:4-amino-4-deoxy-L-arabinose transferase-like glycosyltransferase